MYKIIMLLTLIVLDLNILQKKFIENNSLKTNSFRIQAHDSIMCEYFCFGFIDFMLAGQILTEFTNLLLLSNF